MHQYVVMMNLTPVLTVGEFAVAIAYISERMRLTFTEEKKDETDRFWIRKVEAR